MGWDANVLGVEESGMDRVVGRENGWGGKMSGVGCTYYKEGGKGGEWIGEPGGRMGGVGKGCVCVW